MEDKGNIEGNQEDNIPEKRPEKKDSKKKDTLTEKMRDNPWILATFVLGLVALILIVGKFSGLTGSAITGSVVAGDDAGGMIIDLVKTQGGNAELVNVIKESGLYKVEFSVDGEQSQVYVTLDGKNIVNGLIPVSTLTQQTQPPQQAQESQDIPKSDKPEVELFVMSHCPYGVKAQEVLIPVMEILGGKADVKTRFVSYAMHGKQEIDDNNIEYCIQKEQEDKYIGYLTCFVSSENSEECITSANINKNKLTSCINTLDKQFKITELYNDKSTWLNGRYPLYPVDKSLTEEYGVQGSESLVINGVKISPVQYRWDSDKLKEIICSAFNTKPSECSQSLASSTNSAPSAGSCG